MDDETVRAWASAMSEVCERVGVPDPRPDWLR